jgi:hypothetical protein
MIDRLQERLQVGLGPGLLGGRDQDQGEMRAGQPALDRAADPVRSDRDDPRLRGPTQR